MAEQTPGTPAPDTARRQRLIAIALMCCAFACFSALDATAKWLSPRIGVLETTWVRYFVSFIFVSAFINPWSHPGLMITKHPWQQAIRSLMLLGSTILNFLALRYLQLAETMTIMFLQPLLVALISGPLLGEWVGPRRLAAIVHKAIGQHYRDIVGRHFPAMTAVEVADLVEARAKVEIEVTAVLPP